MNRGDFKLAIDRCIAYDVPDTADLIEELAQKLSEREKQIAAMRERIKWILDYAKRPTNVDIKEQAQAGFSGARAFEIACYELANALDTTQDLSCYILCDAEPVAEVVESTEYNSLGERPILREIDYYNEVVDQIPAGTPLYKARKP